MDQWMLRGEARQLRRAAGGTQCVGRQHSSRLPPPRSPHTAEAGPCGYFGSAEDCAKYPPDLFSPVHR